MSIVQMKCPTCGGSMSLENNQLACPYCGTMILNIIDAKIDADVNVMSPEEFARKIEESKRQFVIKLDNELKVFDVDTIIYNKKIKDATEQLLCGFYGEVEKTLTDVPDTILAAERLRYLAEFKVKNEYELSYYDGDIDVALEFASQDKKADGTKIEMVFVDEVGKFRLEKVDAAGISELAKAAYGKK